MIWSNIFGRSTVARKDGEARHSLSATTQESTNHTTRTRSISDVENEEVLPSEQASVAADGASFATANSGSLSAANDVISRFEPTVINSTGEESKSATFHVPESISLEAQWAAVRPFSGTVVHATLSPPARTKSAARQETDIRSTPAPVRTTSSHSNLLSSASSQELVTSSGKVAGNRFSMLQAVSNHWDRALPNRKILVAVGSRSEARHLAPIIRSLRSRSAAAGEVNRVAVCAAGERTDDIREVLELLDISVDCSLEITANGLTLDDMRVRVLSNFEKLFAHVKPEWIVFTGDTLINGMAAVCAYHSGVQVARVEGASKWNEDVPEEIDRQLVELFSSIHFTENSWSKETLMHEGVPQESIFVIGNPGIDALYESCARLGLPVSTPSSRSSGLSRVLVTVGHRELPDTSIREISRAVGNLAVLVPGLYHFLWPVPTQPGSAEIIQKFLADVPGIEVTPPAGYEQYLRHLSECDLVVTDSLDLQEEAPSLGKPVIFLGSVSNRSEAVRSGIVIPVQINSQSIQAAIRTLVRKLSTKHGQITSPYGDGKASSRVADFFSGQQVLEFGKTALPRLVSSAAPQEHELPAPVPKLRLA